MVRPKSILWFERLYLGSWVFSLVVLAVNWSATKEKLALDPSARRLGVDTMMNIMVGGIGISALITLVLWYFTARQHSVVAKWFVVGFFVLGLLGLPALFAMFARGAIVHGLLQALVFVLHAGAVAMLFQRDARVWLGEIKDGPPADEPADDIVS